MINENKYNEQIESEASQLSQEIYFRKSPKAELQRERIKILKRLQEIDVIEGNEEKREQLLQVEILKRRLAFLRLQKEKILSLNQINLMSAQTTHTLKGGEVAFGY